MNSLFEYLLYIGVFFFPGSPPILCEPALKTIQFHWTPIDYPLETTDTIEHPLNIHWESIESHRKSIQFHWKSMENPFKSIEHPLKTIQIHWKSIENPLQTIQFHSKSIENNVGSWLVSGPPTQTFEGGSFRLVNFDVKGTE